MYVATAVRAPRTLGFMKAEAPSDSAGGGLPMDMSPMDSGPRFNPTSVNNWGPPLPILEPDSPVPAGVRAGRFVLPSTPTAQAAVTSLVPADITAWWNSLPDWAKWSMGGGVALLAALALRPRPNSAFGRRR